MAQAAGARVAPVPPALAAACDAADRRAWSTPRRPKPCCSAPTRRGRRRCDPAAACCCARRSRRHDVEALRARAWPRSASTASMRRCPAGRRGRATARMSLMVAAPTRCSTRHRAAAATRCRRRCFASATRIGDGARTKLVNNLLAGDQPGRRGRGAGAGRARSGSMPRRTLDGDRAVERPELDRQRPPAPRAGRRPRAACAHLRCWPRTRAWRVEMAARRRHADVGARRRGGWPRSAASRLTPPAWRGAGRRRALRAGLAQPPRQAVRAGKRSVNSAPGPWPRWSLACGARR